MYTYARCALVWRSAHACAAECPGGITPCSGHGTCRARAVGVAGSCDCDPGFSPPSCVPYPPSTIACNRTGNVASAVFRNPSVNWINVTFCSRGGVADCGVSGRCAGFVPPNSTANLVADAGLGTVVAAYCESAAGSCVLPEMSLVSHRVASAWTPPLAMLASDKRVCGVSADCEATFFCHAYSAGGPAGFKFCTRMWRRRARAGAAKRCWGCRLPRRGPTAVRGPRQLQCSACGAWRCVQLQ